MELKYYSEYFFIDPNYYPHIDPETKNDPNFSWMTTYPHESFIELMKDIVKMLSRETNNAKNSIWVQGAYGTGKSRLMWTAEKMITCSDEEFNEYFDKYEALRKETDLRTKLEARRRDKILVVSDYSTGEIDSISDLCRRVFEKVTEALVKNGMNPISENTVRGRIADKITSPDFRPVFEVWLENPKYKSKSGLSGKSVDQIAEQLRNVDATSDSMVRSIIDIAKEQGFFAFSFDVDFLIDWIKAIIRVNELDNIIIIWDEFTDFFRKLRRQNEYGSFQKLVKICDSTPFNFVLVAHDAESMKAEGGEASTLYSRFVHMNISMPDNVAFELINDALKINPTPGIQEEYDDLTKEIASYTYESRKAVCAFADINEKLMRSILPIHPMAALLLKYISTEFAANQRSMFNFIKTEDADKLQAFQWFIKNKSPENGDILTIDFLWNFFYEEGTDENTNSVGRSNLDMRIAQILDSYALCEQKLSSNDEKRVMKAVLMMQAISAKLGNGVALLRPTEQNIKLAFEGDNDLENGKAVNIIKNILLPNKILLMDTNGKEAVYGTNIIMGDQTKIDEIKEELRKSVKTSKLIKDGSFLSAFSFKDALKSRYDFSILATVDDIQSAVNRILNEDKLYKFRTVTCFARDEAEQSKMKTKLTELTSNAQYADIIFIDASSNLMGMENWENWLELTAREQHFRNPDPDLANSKAKEAKNLLDEWRNRITGGRFTIYVGKSFVRNCDSISLLYNELTSYILTKYQLTFDHLALTGTIFSNPQYNKCAKIAILAKSGGGGFQEKDVDTLLGEVRYTEKYWEVYPLNNISKLKIMVDSLICEQIEKNGRVAVSTVINMLMEKCGFTPCNLYAYLIGFLLKEYSVDPYRYSEGVNGDNGGKISVEKLGDMIGDYIKHIIKKGKYIEQYIEIMSNEQAAFVSFVSETFGLPDISIVESAASKLRTQYKNKIRYPLWCFKYIDNKGLGRYIDKLSSIMYSDNESNVPTLAGELGKMLLQDKESAKEFSALITSENASKAMKKYLKEFEGGGISTYAEKIGVLNLLEDVYKQIAMEAKSYLWDQENGEEQLRKLLLEYRIIHQTNVLLGKKSNTFTGCCRDWCHYADFLKLPYVVLKKQYSELSNFIMCLVDLKNDKGIVDDKRQSFFDEITLHAKLISTLREKTVDIYKNNYAVYTSGLSDEEITEVMSSMSNLSFMSDNSAFETNLKTQTDIKKKEQKKYQLKKLWKDKTDYDTPQKWSEAHLTPIKILVDESELDKAGQLFKAFSDDYTSDSKTIEQALEYLETEPSFLARMENIDEVEEAFRKKILGRYSSIIYDIREVKEYIQSRCSTSAYEWYGSPAVQSKVKEYASSVYRTKANKGVMDRIDDMPADEAKEYLKRLVKDDMEVGISIIRREGGD